MRAGHKAEGFPEVGRSLYPHRRSFQVTRYDLSDYSRPVGGGTPALCGELDYRTSHFPSMRRRRGRENNSYCLRTYYVPGIVLGAFLYLLVHFL